MTIKSAKSAKQPKQSKQIKPAKLCNLPKVSYHQYLIAENRFYDTTTHLRVPFSEYIMETLWKGYNCSKLLGCKTHAEVYTIIKTYLIDWDIPFPEINYTINPNQKVFT